jgi:chaperonin GroES
MARKNIKPMWNNVLLKPVGVEDETEKGGIVIPDNARKAPTEGKVVAKGDQVTEFKAGDVVLLPQYGGTKVKVGNVEYILVCQDDIKAKVV